MNWFVISCVHAVFRVWFHIDVWCNDWGNHKWTNCWFYWSERSKKWMFLCIYRDWASPIVWESILKYFFQLIFTMYLTLCTWNEFRQWECLQPSALQAGFPFTLPRFVSYWCLKATVLAECEPKWFSIDVTISSLSYTKGGSSIGHRKTGNRIWDGSLFLCGTFFFFFQHLFPRTSYIY